jgi:hypothetical protein
VGGAVDIGELPGGLSSAPVEVCCVTGEKVPVLVIGGLVAVYQHPDGAPEPPSGWAVLHPRAEAAGKGGSMEGRGGRGERAGRGRA